MNQKHLILNLIGTGGDLFIVTFNTTEKFDKSRYGINYSKLDTFDLMWNTNEEFGRILLRNGVSRENFSNWLNAINSTNDYQAKIVRTLKIYSESN